MTKFTQSVRFGLTPALLWRIRSAAQKQHVSVSELVRTEKKNHAPASRTLGRKVFVPTKPN
jgi:hypothetical protein